MTKKRVKELITKVKEFFTLVFLTIYLIVMVCGLFAPLPLFGIFLAFKLKGVFDFSWWLLVGLLVWHSLAQLMNFAMNSYLRK